MAIGEFGLDLLAAVDVAHGEEDGVHGGVVEQIGTVQFQPAVGAVASPGPQLEPGFCHRPGFDERCQLEQSSLLIVGMHDVDQRVLRPEFGWVSEIGAMEGRRVEQVAIAIDEHDRVPDVGDHRAEAFLVFAHRLLGAQALGDIASDGEHGDHVAAGGLHQGVRPFNRTAVAVRAGIHIRRHTSEEIANQLFSAVALGPMNEFIDVAADHVLTIVEIVAIGAIAEQDPAIPRPLAHQLSLEVHCAVNRVCLG